MNPTEVYPRMVNFFYSIKPFLPRRFQIFLRRRLIRYIKSECSNIWPIDSAAAQPPEGWQGWPDGKRFALVLSHDVDTQKGHDTCLHLADLEEKLGFRSSFNFVPERYKLSVSKIEELQNRGFQVCVHGLKHDGKLFKSRTIFDQRVVKINQYLKDWNSEGFTSPSMHRNLDWMHALNIKHSTSTFDTDPFEPHPDGVATIFPFWVKRAGDGHQYLEIPYTLPQDFTLFVLMQVKNADIWKKKLDWIAEKGGMALLNTHPDYLKFNNRDYSIEEYPMQYFESFLEYVKDNYGGQYWHALPRDMAEFWEKHMKQNTINNHTASTASLNIG